MEYLIGLLLPPFIDYFNKNVQSSVEKTWITVFVCFVVAAVIDHSLISGGSFSDVKSILVLFGTLTGEAVTVYQVWWKDSKARILLPGNGVADPTQRG